VLTLTRGQEVYLNFGSIPFKYSPSFDVKSVFDYSKTKSEFSALLEYWDESLENWMAVKSSLGFLKEELYDWTRVIQDNSCTRLVEEILKQCTLPEIAKLAFVRDEEGRKAMDIAVLQNKKILQRLLFLFGRYELKSDCKHASKYGLVLAGIDHNCSSTVVTIKLLKDRSLYDSEINSREVGLDANFIVPIISYFDGIEYK
jgi:hypothetical protein